MKYKFYSVDQIGQPLNLNLLSGILPQQLALHDITEVYDYEGALLIIDSNFHTDNFPQEIYQFRLDKGLLTKVIIDVSYETGVSEHDYNKKIASLAKRGVDAKNILTVLNRGGCNEWTEKFINNISFIDLFAVSAAVRHLIHNQPISQILLADRNNRANLIMARVNKPSRTKIIRAFHESNLRNKTLFGFLGQLECDDSLIKQFVADNQGPLDGALSIADDADVSSQGWGTSTTVYDTSTVSFICETHETNNSVFLTEKTYRPILNRSTFILRSAFPALAYLRSIGFKTFDSVIDESYDAVSEITDAHSKLLVDLTEQLLTAVPDHLDSLQKVVDHNYEILIKFAHSELAHLNKRIFHLLT